MSNNYLSISTLPIIFPLTHLRVNSSTMRIGPTFLSMASRLDFRSNSTQPTTPPLSILPAKRPCLSIKGHDVDRMGEADISTCFLSRGSFRLLRQLPFCLLFLFVYLLFPTLVLILLAFVSHCVPPFTVGPHLLAARVPLRRQFCLCVLSLSWRATTIILLPQFIDIWVPAKVN